MKHVIKDTIAVIGGVGLGAALMYLLDPDKGQDRRSSVAAAASEHGRTLAQNARGYAHEVAGSIGDRASSYISDTRHRAEQAVDGVSDSARNYLSDAADRASRLRDRWSDRANSMLLRARGMVPKEESHGVGLATGITTGTLGLVALGAGVMYFMDSKQGKARRDWAREKVRTLTSRTVQTAQQVGDQVHSAIDEAQQTVSSD